MPQGPPGPQGLPETQTRLVTANHQNWQPEDVGFFDPHLAASFGPAPMMRDAKAVHCGNFHLFIARVREIASSKGDEIVHVNVNTCLRGTALMGFRSSQVSPPNERVGN